MTRLKREGGETSPELAGEKLRGRLTLHRSDIQFFLIAVTVPLHVLVCGLPVEEAAADLFSCVAG